MTTSTDVAGAAWTRALGPAVVSAAVAATVGEIVGYLPLGETGAVALATPVVLFAVLAHDGPRRLVLGLSVAVYVLALNWTYTDWTAFPVYRYTGMIESGAGMSTLFLLGTLAILPSAWLPLRLSRPSGIVLWVLYLLGYVPAMVIPIYVLGPDWLPSCHWNSPLSRRS